MTYSHNNSRSSRPLIDRYNSYYINELRDELIQESIDIGNGNKKKTSMKRGKIESFFSYHCSPNIMAIFFTF